jgi:hypothetical protein
LDFKKYPFKDNYVNFEPLKKRQFSKKKESNKNIEELTSMDPVYEEKDEDNKNEQMKIISSPRVRFMTELKEDVISPRLYFSSFHMNSSNKYDLETDEVIAEDNNENNVENEYFAKKHKNSYLNLEDFIDKKEANFDHMQGELIVNTENIETIKEENIEEDDIMNYHKAISTGNN